MSARDIPKRHGALSGEPYHKLADKARALSADIAHAVPTEASRTERAALATVVRDLKEAAATLSDLGRTVSHQEQLRALLAGEVVVNRLGS